MNQKILLQKRSKSSSRKSSKTRTKSRTRNPSLSRGVKRRYENSFPQKIQEIYNGLQSTQKRLNTINFVMEDFPQIKKPRI